MALLQANPSEVGQLLPLLRQEGFSGRLEGLGLVDPLGPKPWGGLFLPDPSIGRWAQWRQPAGPAAFSLVGQIHTLSTPAALGHLQDLVTEPVQPWDALICSSRAGRAVVEAVLADRERQIIDRSGGSAGSLQRRRPQLPVIPLPLPVAQMLAALPSQQEARQALALPAHTHVVLWLGRLSALTKADPYPLYAVLERVAQRLERPLVLIECGPDDAAHQAEECRQLRALCPALTYVRLGGAQPVEEQVKLQALAAADLAVSLVDNTQETFGLAVAEAMAAGLPVVASDWDGYRDLVRDGIDGFLVPSRWAASAAALSVGLGWQQLTGLQSFPAMSGALAQLVHLDLAHAEAACLNLLQDSAMAQAMGRAGQQRALACFDADQVMAHYEQLFGQLAELRAAAPAAAHQPQPSPLHLDPVRAFAGFASHPPLPQVKAGLPAMDQLPQPLRQARMALWQLLLQAAPAASRDELMLDLIRKHH